VAEDLGAATTELAGQVAAAAGLTLIPANNALEAGIHAVWEPVASGRLKVFHCEVARLRAALAADEAPPFPLS
jgi:hypothetical protein